MTVSKRTRFEVLRRDNHTCRYCGGTGPDVVLTVDHVMPTALGGSDDPSNLVAACHDCNAGKTSTSPDAELVAQVGEDDIRWAQAVRRAADAMLAERQAESGRLKWFTDEWRSWDEHLTFLPDDWRHSVDLWLGAGLPPEVLLDCHHIAMGKRGVSAGAVFAYMGGVARKKIELLHEAARALMVEVTPAFAHCEHCDWDDPEHSEAGHEVNCGCQAVAHGS